MAATLTSSGVNFSDGTTINGTATNTIGSYSWLGRLTTGTTNIGTTLAGSSLRPAGIATGGLGWPVGGKANGASSSGQNTTMSGTWRAMGYSFNGDSCCATYAGATLWVRIS